MSAPPPFLVWKTTKLFCLILLLLKCQKTNQSEDEEKLFANLFRGYQPLIRPVKSGNTSASEAVLISMGVQMVLLISVDEKNQIMYTNVWLTLNWFDYQMVWNPHDYDETAVIRVSPDRVWRPDIVLFNNADGQFEVTYDSNVVVRNTGEMLWVPPAIYKSTCIIDVEYFPFDEQTCSMNFGSWTFDKTEVQLKFSQFPSVDLSYYSSSSIWDIIDCPAFLSTYRNGIQWVIVLRRKTLFYTVVLLIPTVVMAVLSMMVFYLPAKAGEKITLAISILLSLVVFLLLVSKILPESSTTIPLLSKYLLFTFVMNIATIASTVYIVNIYFRKRTTHKMPSWIRVVFLDILARLLLMKRPHKGAEKKKSLRESLRLLQRSGSKKADEKAMPKPSVRMVVTQATDELDDYEIDTNHVDPNITQYPDIVLTMEALKAVEALEYITEHLRQDDEFQQFRDDWMYISMVIDRLFLYIFFGVTLGGTVGILLSSPSVFEIVDQKTAILRLAYKYEWGQDIINTIMAKKY